MKCVINERIVYDFNNRELGLYSRKITLPAATARLLALFIMHNGQQVNREPIIEEVWGKHGMAPSGHSLNKNISLLRKAFSELGELNLIETIPREGFVFRASIRSLDPYSLDITPSTAMDRNEEGHNSNRIFYFLWLTVGVLVLLASGLLYCGFFKNDDVTFVRKIGGCKIFTTRDNPPGKIAHFLLTEKWQKIRSVCSEGQRVIVFYDDNSLSGDNRLKEHFLSVCPADKKGMAYACENYVY